MGTVDPHGASLANLASHRFRLRLECAGCHLHTLGPRAIAEALAELAERTDRDTVLSVLAEYHRITPVMLAAARGDRFPVRPLRLLQP